jgi:hypothetical protein
LISGKNVGVTDANSAASVAQITPGTVTLVFGSENVNASIEAVKKSDMAAVRYGVRRASAPTAEPVFGAVNSYDVLYDGDVVYVEVTPYGENSASRYFGVTIHLTLPLLTVNIGGVSQAITAAGAATAESATAVAINLVKQTQTGTLAVTKANGVTVGYALTSGGTPSTYTTIVSSAAVTYTDGSVLYVRAEGYGVVHFYKYNIALKSNNRNITALTFNGSPVDSIGTGGTGVNVAAGATRGSQLYQTAPASLAVSVTFEDPLTKITGYGMVATSATAAAGSYTTLEPAGTSFNLSGPINDNQDVIIRVLPENEVAYFYRISVSVVADDYGINTITFGTTGGTTTAIVGTGSANPDVDENNTLYGEATVIPGQVVALQNVTVAFTNTTARVLGYGIVNDGDTVTAASYTDLDDPAVQFPLAGPIENGQHLLLKVVSGLGTEWYYRIEITHKSNDLAITRIEIGGQPVTTVGYGAATPNVFTLITNNQGEITGVTIDTTLLGTVSVAPAQEAAGQNVVVTFADSGAKVVAWTVAAGNEVIVAEEDYGTALVDDHTLALAANITSGQHLLLKVQADFGNVWYHRILVTVTP